MTPQIYQATNAPSYFFRQNDVLDRPTFLPMRRSEPSARTLLSLLRPETDLEKKLLNQPEITHGLWWGEPRFGHPEGNVVYHVQEIFENIEQLEGISPQFREQLRLIALLHDSFKYCEDRSTPRDWSKHHGVLARNFAEKFIDDSSVLDVIELHDEAYYIWRNFKQGSPFLERLDSLLLRIQPFLQLFYVFFKCDTQTGDKTQASWKWFEQQPISIQKMIVRADFE